MPSAPNVRILFTHLHPFLVRNWYVRTNARHLRARKAWQRDLVTSHNVTGEIEDLTTGGGKNAAAVALGRRGGKDRRQGYLPENAGKLPKKRPESARERLIKDQWST